MMKHVALAIATIVLFTQCTSAPTKVGGAPEGQWRAKALIKDKEQNRSYIVQLNMNAVRGGKARLDVTSPFGTGVASLVVSDDDVRYVLLDQKRFYYGTPTPASMKPILAMPFDPRWLQNVLFEVPLAGWSCAKAPTGETCRESKSQTSVTWGETRGDKRTIFIEHPKASVQINVQSFTPKVEERKNLFVLSAPDGFQNVHLR